MPHLQGICAHPITVHTDPDRLADLVAERLIALSTTAIAQRDAFHLALSGGSTPKRLYQALAGKKRQSRIEWNRIHLYFGDERAVPPTHADSNYRMAREALIDHVQIPADNVHRMAASPEHIEQDAAAYAELLSSRLPRNAAGLPSFDAILLGLGPDGHTCSLFPDTPILDETTRSVAPVHVARLDSWRLSLTYPVLNAARHLMFLVAGADKAAILRRICQSATRSADLLPVERIRAQGQVEWHLDQAAAAELTL